MDPLTLSLVVGQTITFILLVISEILPSTNYPYSSILQILYDVLQKTREKLNEDEHK
jgi:hypothetical protein